MTCEAWRARLDAYLDNELPAGEGVEIEEHLRTCRDCGAAALGRMQIKQAVRAAAMRYAPAPGFRQQVEKSLAPKRRPMAVLWNPALTVAVALVLLIAVSTVMLVRNAARERTSAELVDLHVAALASPNPVDVVSSDRHTVKPWFQGKLPFTFNLPELEGSQYKLLGGKLVYFDHRPGAQLIFALRKHEMSVFILQAAEPRSAGLSSRAENGFSIETWNAGGLKYVVVSDAGIGDVHALGELMRGAQQH